mgnify:CR=1 FL=1
MKIVVLAGGISTERAVSLVTGSGVCRALRQNGHRAILVDLFLGLEEVPADLEALFDAPDGLCPDAKIEVTAPDLEAVKRSRRDQSPSHIGPHVLDICQRADLVFLGLHGMDGEDGRIQAALDLLGVPYTGAGHLASAIAMDKAVSKQILDACGIPTPKWRLLTYGQEEAETLAQTLPMPCVIKTIGGGSSLGVYLPEDRTALTYRGLELHVKTHRCLLDGEEVLLTPTEFSILRILLENKGAVVSAEELFRRIWKDEYYSKNNNTITAHIRHLREKLKDSFDEPRFIKTIWGVGYKIEDEIYE